MLFALVCGAGLRPAPGQTLSAPEYKIKAAFLYNFAVLTEWPTNAFESEQTPLIVGVLGEDPFGRILHETLSGKKIHGRKIKIERFKNWDDAGIQKSHLLFIAKSEEQRVEKILARLARLPILTVSEIDRFNYRGGMIWLQKRGDEIRFRIRYGSAPEAGLTFSSKLLALAINSPAKNKQGAK